MNTDTWVRPRPTREQQRFDLLLAGVMALAAVTVSLLYARIQLFGEPPAPWVWALGLGAATLPLALRRSYPVPVMLAVSAGFFICGEFGVPDALIINIAIFTAVYTVGAWETNRVLANWSRGLVVVAMILWLVVTLIVMADDLDYLPGLSRASVFSEYATYFTINILTNLLFFGGAAVFGDNAWRSAKQRATLEAQGKELEAERVKSAQQAVALDRIAIARELHDVIAHHVSVMGLHAAAARRTLTRDPQAAAHALDIVEQSAQSTITELRQIVHTLRDPGEPHETQAVGVGQLAELVEGSTRAGVQTTLIVTGEARPVPLTVDVALYRVAQEALTNVRKHAGQFAVAEVRLRFSDVSVEVEVSDTGVTQTLAAPGQGPGGLGLKGMRERMGAVGGTLIAERRERGGFIVRASAPLIARQPSREKAQ